MKLDDFDKAKVLAWLTSQILEDALCSGKTETIDVRIAPVGSSRLLGTARTQLTIDSLEAALQSAEDTFLQSRDDDALGPLREAGEMILNDAVASTPITASEVSSAIRGSSAACLSVLLPWWRFPPTEEVPHPTIPRRSRSVPEDGAVLVHPAKPCTYVLEPIADVVRDGPRSVVHLVVAVAKASPAHQKPSITRASLI